MKTTVKLNGLDHLRAFAICFVLLFHYRLFRHPDWIVSAGKFGWTGVDLFFVLSGYLISSHLFTELAKNGSVSLKGFFIKRSFRILPAYLVVLAVYYFLPAFHEREALSPLWRFLTFTKNFGLDSRTYGTFSHSWSLCVEEQFYLLLPLLLLTLYYFRLFTTGLVLLIALFAAGFLIRWYGWQMISPYIGKDDFWAHWYISIYYPTYNRLDGLLVGIGIAALFHHRPQLAGHIGKRSSWLALIALMVLICAYYLNEDQLTFKATVLGFPLVALGYGLMVTSAISPGSRLYNFRSRITQTVASLSYSIYLVHKGVIHIVQEYLDSPTIPKDGNLMAVICLFAVLLAAFVMQLLVERPFLKLRDRMLRPKQAVAVQPFDAISVK